MTSPTLVIMAAGMGSRYGGLKQIDPVGPGGEIVIDYSIYDALKVGFERIVFIIRQEIEDAFREKVGRHWDRKAKTAYVHQELNMVPPGFVPPLEKKKPWGTAHAIWCCRDVVREPFAVINADDFYGRGSFQSLAQFLRALPPNSVREYAMVGYILENTLSDHGSVARGVCKAARDGYLQEIQEKTRIERRDGGVAFTDDGQKWEVLSSQSIVSMNMWAYTPDLFEELTPRFELFLRSLGNDLKKEFYLPITTGELVGEGRARVRILPTTEQWFGVTYREDVATVKAKIQALVARGAYPERLRS